MYLKVTPGTISGENDASPSKSYTHRALIIGLLAKGKTTIMNPLIGNDTLSTLQAIKAFGAKTELDSELKTCVIESKPLRVPEDVINVGNSGTTLRLMCGIASLLNGITIFTGDSSVRNRPMQPLLDALNQLGAKCVSARNNGLPPIIIQGVVKNKKVNIRGNISSQFLSSLLISCPYKQTNTTIKLISELKSAPYIDMTIDALKRFDVEIQTLKDGFFIEGHQRFLETKFKIPSDFSSAAFLLVGATITKGKVTIRNLDFLTSQGDKRIVDILSDFGANVNIMGNSVTVGGGDSLEGLEVDCSDIPDLFPILAVLGAYAKGRTRLFNAEHLRYKESDRISAMVKVLTSLGARVKELQDGIIIEKGGELVGARIDTFGDHRILMASVIAGLGANGCTFVSDANCYEISYPAFINDLQKLGARITREAR